MIIIENKIERGKSFEFKIFRKNKEYSVLIDEKDLEKVNKYKWFLDTKLYVYAHRKNSKGKDSTIKLHRLIMNCPKGKEVDHINHNTLDNRRKNLRICTHTENMSNSPKGKGKSSKFKCVQYRPNCKLKWEARFSQQGKYKRIGLFSTEIIAAIAYDIYCKKIQKDFANTNKNIFGKYYSIQEYQQALIELKRQQDKQKASKFKGVTTKNKRKWLARICINKKWVYLGAFQTEKEAAKKYDEYVLNHLNHSRKTNKDIFGDY